MTNLLTESHFAVLGKARAWFPRATIIMHCPGRLVAVRKGLHAQATIIAEPEDAPAGYSVFDLDRLPDRPRDEESRSAALKRARIQGEQL